MVEGLANVEGLTNGGRAYQWWKVTFYSESGINQYAVQKTLTDVFVANTLLLLEPDYLRYVLLSYHLRKLLRFFMFL